MFTRDSVIISRNIRTPLTSISRAVGNILQLTYSQLIKSIFASNEQGFAYDPNDLSTMYRGTAGTIPVTGAGQPVGLMLDKSKGLTLGPELVVNGDFSQGTSGFVATGGELSIVGGKLRFTATSAGGAIFLRYYTDSTSNDFYKLETAFTKTTVSDIYTYIYGNGPYRIRDKQVVAKGTASFSELFAIWFVPGVIGEYVEFDFISVKKLPGNHAYQTVPASRPLLVATPQRLDYDAVDNKLTTNLPEQLTGCTVVRSVPNVGTQILTNQTIPTPYNDNIDNCGLIVINRALTASETIQITKLFNKAAGV